MNKIFVYLLLSLLFNAILTETCEEKKEDGTMSDDGCRELSTTNQEDNICVKGASGCEEKLLCLKAVSGECNEYPASIKINKCTKNEDTGDKATFCKETLITCGEEEIADPDTNYCRQLFTEPGYKCVKGTSKCEPEQIECGQETIENPDNSYCQKLKTTEEYICIRGTGNKCTTELIACGEEDEGKSSEQLCPKLGVEEGYKCKKGTTKCEPEQIECGREESGKASIAYCQTLKVNNPSSQACVKDETENACIIATNCADVKVGATDDICAKLAVSEKEKCLKEGNACVVKIKCNGATGASNDDCSAYYVSDSTTKKCVKASNASNENLCEEEIKSPSAGSSPKESSSQAGSDRPGSSSSRASSTKSNEITKNSSSTEKTNTTVSSSKKSDESDGAKGMKISLILLISLLMI